MVTKHLGVAISKPFEQVYGFLKEPENFPKWASGLGDSLVAEAGGTWSIQTPAGTMQLRFTPANEFGILDHWLLSEEGDTIYVPLRALKHPSGTEVVLTLFQLEGMTEEEFECDAAWVAKDLRALKQLLEK
jgi:hypothetical protein